MITEIKGQCNFDGCTEQADSIAGGHPRGKVSMYCDKHATYVCDDDSPEYVVNYPNCTCRFGVN